VPTPALDHDLGLLERIEHLAVEQLVPELCSEIPASLQARARLLPCTSCTSIGRSLTTICSGLTFRPLGMMAALPRREPNFDTLHNARVVAGAERYYRAAYAGAVTSWNLHDQHMFDTLLALLEARGPDAKAVVWAHNSHVGNAAATEVGQTGQHNIGQLCRQYFGDKALLIGFGTDRGTVMAASSWGAEPVVKTVRSSLQGSYGALFRAANPDQFLLDLRRGVHEPLREALSRERLERAIGVMYLPETERVSHYFRSVLPDEFDAFIWLEETRAVTPIPTSGRVGLPDGHPFGTHAAATGSMGLGHPARQ
jgi:hypothetical protein